ncbi:MAG: hypothetical protein KIG81_08575 [Thermoguttaceae bacterium]|nr:hypothetical protein [Thermoguttaceae bacterium]
MTIRHNTQAQRPSRRGFFRSFVALATLRDKGTRRLAALACASAALLVGLPQLFAQSAGDAKMRVVKPFIGYGDVFQWSDLPEIVSQGASTEAEKDPLLDYSWGGDLFFEKEVWQLQFAYKNVRSIDVEYPTADGKLQSRRVWYLVYSVTNTGERLKAVVDDSVGADVSSKRLDKDNKEVVYQFPENNLVGPYKPEQTVYKAGDEEGAVTIVPRFVFVSSSIQNKLTYERKGADDLFVGHVRGAEAGLYYDSFQPLALVRIRQKEGRKGIEILDSTRISNMKILPGQTVWGVATWTDVDPRIDKFSVYVSGLTNACRWELDEDESDGVGASDSQVGAGRSIWRKVLKINFYNPGDEAHSGGKEIYNNLPGELDYEWIYL